MEWRNVVSGGLRWTSVAARVIEGGGKHIILDHTPAPSPGSATNLDRVAQAYVEAFRLAGVARLIANISTRVELRTIGARLVPMTISDGEPTDTYLCSPYVDCTRRVRHEFAILRPRWRGWPVIGLLDSFGGWLRAAGVDRVVHLNNWLLPTNLAGSLAMPYPGTLTHDLAAEFPRHLLAMRCLNGWSDATLMGELAEAGWILLPNRQVWVIDDPEADWAPKPNSALDCAFAARETFTRDDFADMSTADSHAIARLYERLHLENSPRHDPAYTHAFMRITHAIGMIRYIGFREPADGSLAGILGIFRVDDVAAPAIIGYDPQHANAQSLYRLALHAFMEEACRVGLRVNLSSGAADFKRRRGARPQIEYTALYLAHLPKSRQRPILWLKTLLERAGSPLMRKSRM